MDMNDRNDRENRIEGLPREDIPSEDRAGEYRAEGSRADEFQAGEQPAGTSGSNFVMRDPAPADYPGGMTGNTYSEGHSSGREERQYTSADYNRNNRGHYSFGGQDRSSGDAGQYSYSAGQHGCGEQSSSSAGQHGYGEQSGYSAGQYDTDSRPDRDPGIGGYYGTHTPPGRGGSAVINLSKKAFVLILILCMIITSALTFGAMAAYDHYLSAGNSSATNYTLTKSNQKLDYKSIIKKAQDSVVSITTESVATDIWAQNYVTKGAGSGVIIQSDGYIVTCQHVIDGARKITVKLHIGKTYSAEVVGEDADNDIAVIKVKAKNLKAATYGDSDKLEVGDNVVAIGNPLGELGGTATVGIVSAAKRSLNIDGKTMELIQTDASINPGNSGGGLFDASGNLIGIVEAKSTGSDVEGLGFANPIDKVAKIAKNLIKNGSTTSSKSTDSSTPKIGVTVVQLSDSEAKQYGLDTGGLYISGVSNRSAYKAGLRSGDRIISMDGKEISDYDSLAALLKKHHAGDKVKLLISRKGTTKTITTRLY